MGESSNPKTMTRELTAADQVEDADASCSSSTDTTADETDSSSLKKLTFSNENAIHPTLSRDDISQNEREAAWYNEEEYRVITRSCVKQIRMLERGQELRDKKYCSRGLESHTKFGAVHKTKSRALSIDMVLNEQDKQIREGILDEESIAFVYQEVSASSQLWANTIGLRDQRAAEQVMDEIEDLQWEEEVGIASSTEHIQLVDTSEQMKPESLVTRPVKRAISLARAA